MKILSVKTAFIFSILLVTAICDEYRSYDGYKVYAVTTTKSDDVNFLKSLAAIDDDENFDFWSLQSTVGSMSTVMVKPDRQNWFEKSLNDRKIPYEVSIMDLEVVLNEERQHQLKMKSRRTGKSVNANELTFDRYYEHDEINKYLDSLASSNKNVEVRVMGKSYEGRDIKVIKLTNGDGVKKKNSIFIDAGIHSREWVAPATALYIIQQLTDEKSTAQILNDVDVVIVPVVNPDGYQYSHRKDRLWRKTRSKNVPGRDVPVCVGTDGNRNFDFHWGEVGASPIPCMETYRGNKAFSEKETQALRDAVDEIKDTCKFYLTLHSYGNYMLYPWGWTSKLPESWKDLDEIAQVGASAIKKTTGTIYTVGSSTNVLYAAAGGSDDYMFGIFNIPISITMELPGGGPNGFDMPASRLENTVKESAVGIFAMIEAVARKYN